MKLFKTTDMQVVVLYVVNSLTLYCRACR